MRDYGLTQADLYQLELANRMLMDSVRFNTPPSGDPSIDINSSSQDIADLALRYKMEEAMDIPAASFPSMDSIYSDKKKAEKYLDLEYGFNPLIDNESFYSDRYEAQPFSKRLFESLGKGLGRFGTTTFTKTAQTFGNIAGFVYAAAATPFSDKSFTEMWADNGLSKIFSNLEEEIKNQWMPIFKPADWDKRGFFSKLGEGRFWSDEVIDGISFLASTYAGGSMFNKLLPAKLANFGFKGNDRLSRGLRATGNFAGIDKFEDLSMWAYNVSTESAMEASEVYKRSKESLIEAGLDEIEASRIAGEKAAQSFKGNLGVLSVSALFENRFIFKPLNKAINSRFSKVNKGSDPIYAEGRGLKFIGAKDAKSADDFLKVNTPEQKVFSFKDPLGRFKYYSGNSLKNLARGFVFEGLWEENAQLAIERLASGSNLNFSNFINKLYDQTKSAINPYDDSDPEAETSIGLGAVISLIGGAPGAFSGRKNAIKNREIILEDYMKARDDFFSILKSDLYEKDENGKPVYQDGRLVFDAQKFMDLAEKLGVYDEQIGDLANELSNPIQMRTALKAALSEFTLAARRAGVFDKVIKNIESIPSKDKETIKELGFNPDDVLLTPREVVSTMKKLSGFYDQSFGKNYYFDKPKGISNETFELAKYERSVLHYEALVRRSALEEVNDDYAANIKKGLVETKDINLFEIAKIRKMLQLASQDKDANEEITDDLKQQELELVESVKTIFETEKEEKTIEQAIAETLIRLNVANSAEFENYASISLHLLNFDPDLRKLIDPKTGISRTLEILDSTVKETIRERKQEEPKDVVPTEAPAGSSKPERKITSSSNEESQTINDEDNAIVYIYDKILDKVVEIDPSKSAIPVPIDKSMLPDEIRKLLETPFNISDITKTLAKKLGITETRGVVPKILSHKDSSNPIYSKHIMKLLAMLNLVDDPLYKKYRIEKLNLSDDNFAQEFIQSLPPLEGHYSFDENHVYLNFTNKKGEDLQIIIYSRDTPEEYRTNMGALRTIKYAESDSIKTQLDSFLTGKSSFEERITTLMSQMEEVVKLNPTDEENIRNNFNTQIANILNEAIKNGTITPEWLEIFERDYQVYIVDEKQDPFANEVFEKLKNYKDKTIRIPLNGELVPIEGNEEEIVNAYLDSLDAGVTNQLTKIVDFIIKNSTAGPSGKKGDIIDKVIPKEVKNSSGWKVRFNINAVNDDDYNSKAEKLSVWLDNYFGTNKRTKDGSEGFFAFKDGVNIWKHLAGGDKGEADFTIYIGSKEDAIKFAKHAEESEIKDLLKIGEIGSDKMIGNIIKGRFDSKEFKYFRPDENILKKTLETEGLSKDGTYTTETKSGIKILVNDGTIYYSIDGGKNYESYKSIITLNKSKEILVEIRDKILEDIYKRDFTGAISEDVDPRLTSAETRFNMVELETLFPTTDLSMKLGDGRLPISAELLSSIDFSKPRVVRIKSRLVSDNAEILLLEDNLSLDPIPHLVLRAKPGYKVDINKELTEGITEDVNIDISATLLGFDQFGNPIAPEVAPSEPPPTTEDNSEILKTFKEAKDGQLFTFEKNGIVSKLIKKDGVLLPLSELTIAITGRKPMTIETVLADKEGSLRMEPNLTTHQHKVGDIFITQGNRLGGRPMLTINELLPDGSYLVKWNSNGKLAIKTEADLNKAVKKEPEPGTPPPPSGGTIIPTEMTQEEYEEISAVISLSKAQDFMSLVRLATRERVSIEEYLQMNPNIPFTLRINNIDSIYNENAMKGIITVVTTNNNLDESTTGNDVITIDTAPFPGDPQEAAESRRLEKTVRFKFMNKMIDDDLFASKYVPVLKVNKNNNIFVHIYRRDLDNQGKEVYTLVHFDENLNEFENWTKGSNTTITFNISDKEFKNGNHKLPREEVLYKKRGVDSLYDFPHKDEENFYEFLVNYIKTSGKVVTGSINLITTGLLPRSGVTNSYMSKTDLSAPRISIDSLKGKIRPQLFIFTEDSFIRKVPIFKGSIYVEMFRNIKDRSQGTEMIEVLPNTFATSTNPKEFEELFKKLLNAELPATYIPLLKVLLPTNYTFINFRGAARILDIERLDEMFGNDMEKNLKIFQEHIKLEDLMNTPVNIDKALYERALDGDLSASEFVPEASFIFEDYVTFVNKNLTTSIKMLNLNGEQIMSRVNRRFVISINDSYAEMKRFFDENPEVKSDEQIGKDIKAFYDSGEQGKPAFETHKILGDLIDEESDEKGETTEVDGKTYRVITKKFETEEYSNFREVYIDTINKIFPTSQKEEIPLSTVSLFHKLLSLAPLYFQVKHGLQPLNLTNILEFEKGETYYRENLRNCK